MKLLMVIFLLILSLTSQASCQKSLAVKIDLGFDLILGENSVALFDQLQTDSVAGLYRIDAEKKIDSRTSAFIAGLTNLHQKKIFVFLNLRRIRHEPSIIVHESVHMAKILMTLKHLPNVDLEKDPYLTITDDNEEEFAEMVELVYELIQVEYLKFESSICHSIQTL